MSAVVDAVGTSWRTIPLGRIAVVQNGTDYKDVEVAPGTEADPVPVVGSGGPFALASRPLFVGETVLLGRKGTIGRPLYWKGPVWTVDTMFYTRINPGFDVRYFYYCCLDIDFARFSTNTALPSVTASDLKAVRLHVPALREQRAIVEYLDRETGRIDGLIAKQEQLLDRLKERWRSLLAAQFDTSIRGAATRLKRHASIQTGLTLNGGAEFDSGIVMPYLRVANVQAGRVDISELAEVLVPLDGWQRYALRDGDVLMTEGGDADKLGRGSLWTAPVSPCIHQNHVFALRCKPTLFNRWLVYFLESPPARRYFERTAKQSTNLASTNSTTLGNLPLDLPDIREQKRVVVYLDEASAGAARLAETAGRAITLLRERRQALISAAVTGKIDVRGR